MKWGGSVYESANEISKGIFEASLDICLILKFIKELLDDNCKKLQDF
jgi:hypothetical protein